MYSEKEAKKKANCLSVLLHFFVFIIAAAAGAFIPAYHAPPNDIIDVVVYDVNGGSGGGGGVVEQESVPAQTLSGEIVIKNDDTINEQQTEEQRNEVKPSPDIAASAMPAATNTASGSSGRGAGDGIGEGSGQGAGTGSGSGVGNGNGNGNGNGDALAPKIPPSLISDASPKYPKDLRQQGVEGSVKVKILVGANGRPEGAEVVESSGRSGFDSAALEAAYRCVFAPAKNVYGDAVRCYVYRNFQFKIK